MIGCKNYSNGTKETWRGWQWNRIVDFLAMEDVRLSKNALQRKLRDTTVLYLCGPDDADRRAAIPKGFRSHNLIAVDADQSNIDAVRKSGGLGVCGYLEDVLAAWPKDWKIGVVIADLCGGMTNHTWSVMVAALNSGGTSVGTILSFNLFRGRDSFSNEFRNSVKTSKKMTISDLEDQCVLSILAKNPHFNEQDVKKVRVDIRRIASRPEWIPRSRSLELQFEAKADPINRAKMMWLAMLNGPEDEEDLELVDSEVDEGEWAYYSSPSWMSYRSSGNSNAVMDSGVFKLPFHYYWPEDQGFTDTQIKCDRIDELWDGLKTNRTRERPRDMIAKLAALRAVRTMAMQKSRQS